MKRKHFARWGIFCCFFTALLHSAFLSGCKAPQQLQGYTKIFNEKTLDDWDGDTLYWRVENGALVGEVTPKTLLTRNNFIIWRGGTVRNFEFKAQYRITRNGNSGINYRSEELKDIPYAMRGYQGDIDGYDQKLFTGMNYEERRRTTLAKRGQKVIVPETPAGDSLQKWAVDNIWTRSVVTASLGNPDSLKSVIKEVGSWNDYTIIANGNHLQHFVNGVLMSDVTDNDKVHSRMSGLLGVQVHVGPPMKIEFRQIYLKQLP